jgi:hypothetical protein
MKLPRLLLTATLLVTSTLQAANRYIELGSSASTMQAVINSAITGDVVLFRAGTHVLTTPITFKSGITVRGDWASAGISTLDATSLATPLILNHASGNVSNFTLQTIYLKNIQIRFQGTLAHNTYTGITLLNCKFSDIKNKGLLDTAYVLFTYGNNNTIDNCSFNRSNVTYFGRAIQLFKTHNFIVKNNTTTGYFTNALAINGVNASLPEEIANRPFNVTITGNTFNRTASASESPTDENLNEDHGIYVANFKTITITGNSFKGWSPTSNGGVAKLRNGDGAIFSNNICNGSGVLLYTYNDQPAYLKNIKVESNTFTQSAWDNILTVYKGVGYYRNSSTGTEESIRIYNNTIPQGCIFIAGYGSTVSSNFNLNGGGIYDNKVAALNALSAPANVTRAGTTYQN